jgi:putative endonuclease
VSGATSYHAGLCAEEIAERAYERAGQEIVARRWRGQSGEIDLVVKDGARRIFVEVKKSRSFSRAAERLSKTQMARIYGAASEYIGQCSEGQNTEVRFDLALVDRSGAVQVIENAFGQF